jgi:hypothetical protein
VCEPLPQSAGHKVADRCQVSTKFTPIASALINTSPRPGEGRGLFDVLQDFGSTGCDDFDGVHGHDSNLTLNTLSMNEVQRPTRDVVAENIDGAGQAHESGGSASVRPR